ncbi:MAG: acyltransferase [Planctomycetota bacterium]
MVLTATGDLVYANTAHKSFRNTRIFGSLDGLRCLSILAVIWHHTASNAFDLPLAGRGHHGVTLFFAISGFLITTLLIREKGRNGTISLKKFYIRRSLRIFPLYYAVLGIYVVLVFAMERGTEAGDTFMGNLVPYLTYTSNWFVDLHGERVIFYFAWSLATEEQFYLFWPYIQKRCSYWTPAYIMSGLLVITYLASYGYLGLPDSFLLTVLQSIMPGICLGAILAHLLHHKRTFPALMKVLGHRFSAPLFLAALIGYCALPTIDDWIVHALGMLLVGSCVCREDHFLQRPFNWSPIRWMGVISYGMYMLHMLAKNAVGLLAGKIGFSLEEATLGIHPAVLEFLGTTIFVVIAATISYKTFEAYFLKLKSRFSTA